MPPSRCRFYYETVNKRKGNLSIVLDILINGNEEDAITITSRITITNTLPVKPSLWAPEGLGDSAVIAGLG